MQFDTASDCGVDARMAPASVQEVARILAGRFGDFDHYNRKNPLEELLFIVCSTKTDEKKYLDTYKSLRRRFPRFDQLAIAPVAEIAESLKGGGLYNQKALVVKRIMDKLTLMFGRPTLAPLKHMGDTEAEDILLSLPGVGKKTARCILMYSFGREVYPVDTHCWRIAIRLGWIVPSCSNGRCYPKDMDYLQDRIPPSLRYTLHVNMLPLGREICTVREPKCDVCPITHLCPKIGVAVSSKFEVMTD